jgi:hypothetical protein
MKTGGIVVTAAGTPGIGGRGLDTVIFDLG